MRGVVAGHARPVPIPRGRAALCGRIGYRRGVADKPKSLVRALSRRGPHRVLRGDLAFAGVPGIVCTPEAGFGLPAVVFGHGWLTGPQHYMGTLAHLASWGFVVVAPSTARGPVPSAREFAEDLSTAADIATGVRLGPGRISVNPGRVAMAGHGFGAGAAVLAAARYADPAATAPVASARKRRGAAAQARPFDPAARRPVAAVAALYPATVEPPAPPAAAGIDAPLLLLSEPDEHGALAPAADALAAAWGGELTARTVPGAGEATIAEHQRMAAFLGMPRSDRKIRTTTKACLTGYLLATVGDDKKYAVFTDQDTPLGRTAVPVDEPAAAPAKPAPVTLLRAVAGR